MLSSVIICISLVFGVVGVHSFRFVPRGDGEKKVVGGRRSFVRGDRGIKVKMMIHETSSNINFYIQFLQIIVMLIHSILFPKLRES